MKKKCHFYFIFRDLINFKSQPWYKCQTRVVYFNEWFPFPFYYTGTIHKLRHAILDQFSPLPLSHFVTHHALGPPVTNCHTFSDPSPSSVTYFMDGPMSQMKLIITKLRKKICLEKRLL